jgi:acetolactate synthase-1/3 small subunit
MKEEIQRRVISVFAVNEQGALARIAGLFAGRGYNIDSLTVAPIPQSMYSRFTIETKGNKKTIEQIIKQLNKLIPVLKVIDSDNIIEKETVIVKFSPDNSLSDIDVLCKTYNGKIMNVDEHSMIAVVVDEPSRISNFLKIIKKYSPKEIVRGGIVSMEK